MTCVRSKFTVPDVQDVIRRDRLFDLLDDHSAKPVIMVIGQAAQGKSTLIASYLRDFRDTTVWIHLDREDADPAALFDLIITALEENPEIDPLPMGFSKDALGAGKNSAAYSEILSSLLGSGKSGLTLVLDDLEALADDAPAYDFLQELIDILPENSRMVLLSRSLPRLGIQKLKLQKKLFILDNKDLAFTLEETHQLFQGRMPVNPISHRDLQKLHAITDGWAGGLILLAESLHNRSDMTRLPEQLKGEALGFFAEEIFKGLPEGIKRFLVRAALFDVIDPDIMGEFSSGQDALAILAELEKRNLFVQRLEQESARPVFRFNKLFKSFLEDILMSEMDPRQLEELHIRAGTLFREKKEFDAALKYFLKAGKWEDAAGIIKVIGTDRILRGKVAYLAQSINALPETMVWKDPWLIYFLTMTRRISGGRRNIDDFNQALELFLKNNDSRGIMLTLAHLIEAAVFLQKPHDLIKGWIEQAEDALVRAKENTHYSFAKAVLWLQIGFGCIAGTGDGPRGLSACKNASLLADLIRNRELKYRAAIVSVLGFIQAGDFETADRELKRAANPDDQLLYPEYRALKNLVAMELLLNKGDMEPIENLLTTSEKDIETFGLLFFYPWFIKTKAMVFLYRKDFTGSEQLADHLSDISILAGNDFFLGLAHRIRAMSLYHRGDFLKAEIETEKSLEHLKKNYHNRHFYQTGILYGLIQRHRKKSGPAETVITEALDFFDRLPSPILAAEAHCGKGLCLWSLQQRDQAIEHLSSAISLVIRERYIRFMSMSPGDFAQALLLYGIFLEEEIPRHLVDLITGVYREPAARQVETLLSVSAITGKRALAARLHELAALTLPTLTIETFGEFKIVKNTTPPEEIRWEGSKPKMLLKSILVHGGRDIPKEILIEDIWPETTQSSGEKKFKVNLHRLRKSLEAASGKESAAKYLKLEGGYVSLDDHRVITDVNRFSNLISRARTCESHADIDGAVDCLEEAAALYRGDFLAEDPYLDWIVRKREELSRVYMSVLERCARLHESRGDIAKAAQNLRRLLEKDPLNESVYRWLMRLYHDSGRKNSAMRIFQDLAATLKQEIDAEPDESTRDLYMRIRNS